MSPTTLPRASRWEVLGAWLHVWTPPRGVEIPAPPSRHRVAVWAALTAIAVGILLVLTVPRIDGAKDERAAQLAATEAAQDAARRAETIRLQRAGFGMAAGGDAALADARAAILTDARARHATGELGQRPAEVTCSPAAGSARSDLRRYSCVAAVTRLADVAAGPQRTVGYPFSLVVQPSSGAYAWCRALPVPAEGSTGRSGVRIPQPAPCRGDATPTPPRSG